MKLLISNLQVKAGLGSSFENAWLNCVCPAGIIYTSQTYRKFVQTEYLDCMYNWSQGYSENILLHMKYKIPNDIKQIA